MVSGGKVKIQEHLLPGPRGGSCAEFAFAAGGWRPNSTFNAKQQAFLDFVLSHYVSVGVEELEQRKLNPLLRLKYHDSISDSVADLGGQAEETAKVFVGFQKYLYSDKANLSS